MNASSSARLGFGIVVAVFILAENRLNLQQVFDELERLFMQPQVEIHDAEPMFNPFGPIVTPGASETFRDAGVLVLSNRQVPEGKQIESALRRLGGAVMEGAVEAPAMAADAAVSAKSPLPQYASTRNRAPLTAACSRT